jgi:hypothetical protein
MDQKCSLKTVLVQRGGFLSVHFEEHTKPVLAKILFNLILIMKFSNTLTSNYAILYDSIPIVSAYYSFLLNLCKLCIYLIQNFCVNLVTDLIPSCHVPVPVNPTKPVTPMNGLELC